MDAMAVAAMMGSGTAIVHQASPDCTCASRAGPRVLKRVGLLGSRPSRLLVRKQLDVASPAVRNRKTTAFPPHESPIADRLFSSHCVRVRGAYEGKKSYRTEQPADHQVAVDSDGWLKGYGTESSTTIQTTRADHKSGYVALLGKANVGKSTLINSLIGQKICIVTHKPQTTRHRILGIMSEDEYQVVLFDTPGIIPKKRHKLDELMMQNLRYAMANADAILVVIDVSEANEAVKAIVEEGQDLAFENKPAILILNKTDMLKPDDITRKVQWYEENGGLKEVLPVSAKLGTGMDLLKNWILDKMPLGPAYYPKDIVSEHSQRFFVAEILREKIFLLYHQEIPYCTQVQVVAYRERDAEKKDYIEMEIYAEKDSQKGILLGKGGLALKTLAVAARRDIEAFVGKSVYLELKVKVKEGWREDAAALVKFGLDGKSMGRAVI